MEPFDHASALEGCARGDAASLRRLYDQEAGFLLAVALRIVRRREVAADVLHDAVMDIWERAHTFDRSRGAGRAWITSIVRHRALKHVRAAGRETDLDPEAGARIADEAPDPFVALAASQEGARLHGCLSQLDADKRQVILLAYVHGLSQSEIAERLGTPLGTVKAWVRRSLIALKDCLS
ncbi:sigma-70 family RNA polymerase sigma factor [Methylobacterium brachythecii]|uniref:RNA polymerase sigma factor n=1 Tax=Methylobacterium brachythecii TaxID=1176177 RepID=A0A7W6F6R4_9HYPH|nr:sigma-70 family RNA polymerase sigma factor [Methylobacterium brachythecii]MBB3902316.1 RNA polymerase sigma-70 factor (ECF subfamily) [Methylobacterium brachythecii]GLS42164.1 RNA polymerase sigma factor [Methylobacterium brachythecii]